jgi:hypothetical protein
MGNKNEYRGVIMRLLRVQTSTAAAYGSAVVLLFGSALISRVARKEVDGRARSEAKTCDTKELVSSLVIRRKKCAVEVGPLKPCMVIKGRLGGD